MPRWTLASLALLGGAAIVLVTVRILGATSGPEPNTLLNLADSQLKRGQIQIAQAYVAQAEQSSPDAAERARIREIRATIQRVVRAKQDARAMEAANAAFAGRIIRFEATYLDGQPVRREIAREFVRILDEWLTDHREVCSRSEDGQAMAREVESRLVRYRPIARTNEPDTADDVLFRADRRTRRKARSNFREAVALVDAWLAANPDAPDLERVRAQRAEWIEESAEWFEEQCIAIERLADSGYLDDAIERMRFIAEEASMPAWAPAANDKLEQLRARTDG